MATARSAGDWLHASGNDLLLQVRVQPRASHARLDSIARGASARSKQVRIAGAAGEVGELRSRLLAALAPKA
jgi:uncharacterized protein YggU (UPF0235/DUF167 family)